MAVVLRFGPNERKISPQIFSCQLEQQGGCDLAAAVVVGFGQSALTPVDGFKVMVEVVEYCFQGLDGAHGPAFLYPAQR